MNKNGKLICIKKCSNCGKEVEIRHKNRLNNKHIYCSKECEIEFKKKALENQKGYLNCECPICHKKFHLKPCSLGKSETHYCSRECHRLAKKQYMKGEKNHQYGLKGAKNSSWKSDKKITSYGYVKIRVLDHPFRDADDMVFEHRLIAEKYLLNDENSIEINGKKYLKPEYEVHHINKKRTDNRLENLLVLTRKEHAKIHSNERANKICKKVNKLTLNKEFIETYNSVKEAGERNNIFPQNITNACKKDKGFAGGYLWEYKK